MIVTVFRNRLRPEALDEYGPAAAHMSALAAQMPGFISAKTFSAEDGERLTLVEFESEAAQRAWRDHAQHVPTQARGRQAFYSEYKLQVCQLLREAHFKAP